MNQLAPRKSVDINRMGELLLRNHFNRTEPAGLTSFERHKAYEMMKVRIRNLSDSAAEYKRNIKEVVDYLEI